MLLSKRLKAYANALACLSHTLTSSSVSPSQPFSPPLPSSASPQQRCVCSACGRTCRLCRPATLLWAALCSTGTWNATRGGGSAWLPGTGSVSCGSRGLWTGTWSGCRASCCACCRFSSALTGTSCGSSSAPFPRWLNKRYQINRRRTADRNKTKITQTLPFRYV